MRPTRLCWHNAAQSSTQTLSQVAVHRGKGNIPAAIDTLAKFLDLSPLDADGWQELSELYIMVRADPVAVQVAAGHQQPLMRTNTLICLSTVMMHHTLEKANHQYLSYLCLLTLT